MTPDERKATVRRLNDELWNKGNLDIADEVLAGHCSIHDPSFPVDGVAGLKEQVRQLRQANPDLHMDTHDILCDGDMTCERWTIGATARGEFRGIPGTGKTYVMTGMSMEKWDGDRIVELWVNYDLLGTLQQLGVIPETAQEDTGTRGEARA